MNDDLGQWKWVDEDPFEQLLNKSKGATAESKPIVESPEPVRSEEAPVNNVPTSVSEPKPSVRQVRPVEKAKAVEPLAPVETAAPKPAPVAERREIPTNYYEQAISLEKLEKWEEAAKLFRQALEVEPGRAEALIGLGACLLHLDGAEEALDCFKQSLFSDAGRKRALLGKAVALHKLTRYDDADRAYRELLQTSPDSAEVLSNLVALSVVRRDATAVAEYSNRLLQLDSNAKAALQGLATLALWNHDQAAAIDYCTRLVDLEPKCFEGRHNLAFAKQKMIPAERVMRSIA